MQYKCLHLTQLPGYFQTNAAATARDERYFASQNVWLKGGLHPDLPELYQ
jgi:hypothetical protein